VINILHPVVNLQYDKIYKKSTHEVLIGHIMWPQFHRALFANQIAVAYSSNAGVMGVITGWRSGGDVIGGDILRALFPTRFSVEPVF